MEALSEQVVRASVQRMIHGAVYPGSTGRRFEQLFLQAVCKPFL
ncbi:MAG: hypothetical protein ACI8Z1_002277 [Candidatus Azotimanducaceae bacterium]|jgi:hypothetical protein